MSCDFVQNRNCEYFPCHAGADPEKMEIMPINDIETVFNKIDELKSEHVYIISNMKPVKQIRQYFAKRKAQEEAIQ